MNEATGVMAPPAETLRFSYHRTLAPMIWALFAISVVELLVVHLIVSARSPTAALIVSTLTLLSMAWVVAFVLSLKRLPATLDADALVMRVGFLKSVRVPLGQVTGVRDSWPGGFLKDRTVLNLALFEHPNVMVDLSEPLALPGPRKREVTSIAQKLDDPAAFRAALARRKADV